MPFKHSCFISYARGNGSGQTLEQFVHELKRAIDDNVDFYLDELAFLDEDRLRGGDLWNEALAQAICESLCMIVVYTPKYERHLYCRREYEAMERLEEQRLALIRPAVSHHGLIIPIIFKGDLDDLPEKITKRRQHLNFTRYNSTSVEIRKNPDFVGMIEQIADTINRLYRAFEDLPEDPCRDCDGFLIPGEDEVAPWRPPRIPPFPGRSEGS